MTRPEDLQAERVLRARYFRSERTRADWVWYVYDVETLRKISRWESLI